MADSPPTVPQNPYAPPRETSGPHSLAVDSAAPLSREEVRAFVGKSADYYWRHWFSREQVHLASAGFNKAAFFLNLSWLLYRRMYREFWVVTGLLFVGEIALGFLEQMLNSTADTRPLDRLIQIALGVTVGVLGNGLYLRRAKIAVAAVRAQESDPQRRLELIEKKGGTSWPAALLGTAGLVSLGALLAVLAAQAP